MKITLPKPPSINALYRSTCRNGYPSVYMTDKGKDYYEMAYWYIKQQSPHAKPLEGRICVSVDLYYCGLMDIDNILKVSNDVLTKSKVIVDDKQIDVMHLKKIRVPHRKDEKIEMEIEEIKVI